MEIKPEELQRLQESAAAVPALQARLDRLEEDNQRLMAREIVSEALRDSGLKERGQKRVFSVVLATIPIKEGKLDTEVLKASTKTAIEEEVAYLRESGAITPVVHGAGGNAPQTQDGDAVLAESGKSLDASVKSILNIKEAK